MMMNTHCKFATTFGDRHPHLRLRIYSKSSEAMSYSCLQNSILYFTQFLSCYLLYTYSSSGYFKGFTNLCS
ncbi:hypothetical protein QL285_091223 [Trifolium repens]|nr:hypothetical protein QL285_091223 [Trifolium repens]